MDFQFAIPNVEHWLANGLVLKILEYSLFTECTELYTVLEL